jgi:hypothetical protein
MSANFKKMWYVSCVECAKQAPLIGGEAKKVSAAQILVDHYRWTFPQGKPHCPKHSITMKGRNE